MLAVACALLVFLVTKAQHGRGLTELTYFLLAPYYLAIISLRPQLFFGASKRQIIVALGAGAAASILLYAADVALRASIFQNIHVAWRPAPVEMIMLGLAAAIVETVLVQVGVQAKLKGWFGVVSAALLFWALHLSPNPQYLLAGFTLAGLQVLTRRPGASLIAHAGYNVLIALVPPLP